MREVVGRTRSVTEHKHAVESCDSGGGVPVHRAAPGRLAAAPVEARAAFLSWAKALRRSRHRSCYVGYDPRARRHHGASRAARHLSDEPDGDAVVDMASMDFLTQGGGNAIARSSAATMPWMRPFGASWVLNGG